MDSDIPPERNALPNEVDDHPDSGMPRQLRTQADNEPTLSAREAAVAGARRNLGDSEADMGVETAYGEASDAQQSDERLDVAEDDDADPDL